MIIEINDLILFIFTIFLTAIKNNRHRSILLINSEMKIRELLSDILTKKQVPTYSIKKFS